MHVSRRWVAILILTTVSVLAAGAAPTTRPAGSSIPPLDIGDITFDPIGPGKNRVRFSVRNRSSDEQRAGLRVIARSADGKNEWKGLWEFGRGSPTYDDGKYVGGKTKIDPNESFDAHYLFQIPEPFGPKSTIAVEFCNYLDPKQVQRAQKREPLTPYATKRFMVEKLKLRDVNWSAMPPASNEQAGAAKDAFAEAQLRLRIGLPKRASELFSRDFRQAESAPIALFFQKRLYPKEPSWHTWDGRSFVKFAPGGIHKTGHGVVMLARDEQQQVRAVEMIEEDGRWKIDWIHAPAK